ncbi:hypothetical protein HAX54_047193, partial [Datura stramonium]|nr:hypothetical protein [Datura stramonium]
MEGKNVQHRLRQQWQQTPSYLEFSAVFSSSWLIIGIGSRIALSKRNGKFGLSVYDQVDLYASR